MMDLNLDAYPQVVLSLGDDISTDTIYPGRFMATVLPSETPQFAFADLVEFNRCVRTGEIHAGSVIIAGKNFGCGSSREQAVSCLRGPDLTVIARGVARIFLQNAINLGLRIILCPQVSAREGDRIEVTEGEVLNHSSGTSYKLQPLPAGRLSIMKAGGLIPFTRIRLMEKFKV
jgi:3-isopropylmalate/(R)-2-methylmalate dehydratase small subunit